MPDPEPIIVKPAGVQLREPEDFAAWRGDIFEKVKTATANLFPFEHNGLRAELHNLEYEPETPYDPAKHKQALLEDKFVTRRLRGDVHLLDKDGKLLDMLPNFTVTRVPVMSDRGTFTHNGSSYMAIYQARLLPGLYGRHMSNGQVEVHANVKPGTGVSWRAVLDPETAQFKLRMGGGAADSGAHLYSVLRDIGVQDDELKTLWGEGTWNKNAAQYNPKALGQAYRKLVPTRAQIPDASREVQAAAVRDALDRGQVLEHIYNRNMLTPAQVKVAAEASEDFTPDFTPDDLREEYNALYGRHGPRLASMKAWPEEWIDHSTDPLGWLEWYNNYHNGRRAEGDTRQIQRWRAMRNRHGAAFVRHPTPRRAYALRNWAVDAIKLLPEEQRPEVQKAMAEYRDQAWKEWADKQAEVSADVLHDMACALEVPPDLDCLAQAVMKDASTVKKASLFALLVRHDPEYFAPSLDEQGRCLLKSASTTLDVTDFAEELFHALG